MKRHLAMAVSCGLEAALAVYALIRIVQVLLLPEPNPALPAGPHSGYFWRLWIAGYAGVFVALLAALLVPSTDRLAHVATRLLPVAATAIALVGLFFP